MKAIVFKEDGCDTETENGKKLFNEDYDKYVAAHGHHFTNDLAEYASSCMDNADDDDHSWSCSDVLSALKKLDLSVPPHSTLGDMTYTANMAYADFYPIVIKDAAVCVLYANAVATDVDGYEGIQFYRWLADLMAQGKEIEWAKYI